MARDVRRKGWFRPESAVDYLLLLVPAAIVLGLLRAPPTLVFLSAAAAIIPLAGIMGRSTERLAERAGPGIGGLLNATFGNAAELIIAIIGLSRGLGEVVKASITGSIIGNSLLVLGLSLLVGGLRYPVQTFNRTAASVGSTLMALAAIGMIVPSLFWHAAQAGRHLEGAPALGELERGLSLEIAVVLGVVYLLSLLFSLRTHKHLYQGEAHGASIATDLPLPEARMTVAEAEGRAGGRAALWGPVWKLLGSSALVAVLAELLVGALEPTAHALGLTDLFVGVIVVAVVGNAAEHASAVFAALRNQVDLALNISIGSSLQIALFVTPLLLFLSYFIGPSPIDLHFTLFEVGAVVIAVMALALVSQDGESNWMEGVLLLAVYAILGIAFYFLPA